MTDSIDDETLALMRGYCGRDPREPDLIEVPAFLEYGDEEWKLPAFLEKIAAAVEEIPPEARSEAVVLLSGGDADSNGSLRITYVRPENAQEVAENVRRALDYARETQARERATYERLKQKFGE